MIYYVGAGITKIMNRLGDRPDTEEYIPSAAQGQRHYWSLVQGWPSGLWYYWWGGTNKVYTSIDGTLELPRDLHLLVEAKNQ
jgi:hypothetical protein